MKFECPHCRQRLSISASAAGRVVRCPSCDNRLQIPATGLEQEEESLPSAGSDVSGSDRSTPSPRRKSSRQAWKEADPTNPSLLKSVGIGFGLLIVWFAILLPFNPPAEQAISSYSMMQFVSALFYKHLVVSLLNTFFFTWAMAIIFLKYRKIRHQKAALMLDVLPTHLGKEIDASNVGLFIDHVYHLPASLRDSLMVNRIRKALEFYEIRQNSGDVREMMAMQSDIDSVRIGGSYTLLRAFLWAIPLMGFIGTVVGLSQAIGGMNFSNVEDIVKILTAINKVTGGLGTAFDATLLGLVLALTLNFPLNSLAKQEDDTLNTIDAFCNEVLLPRLKNAAETEQGGSASTADLLVKAIAGTQEKFLADLNELSRRMNEYSANMDRRMDAFQKNVTSEFVTNTVAMREEVKTSLQDSMDQVVKFQQTLGNIVSSKQGEMTAQTEKVLKDSLDQVTRYIGGLESGISGLNKVLKELGEKQVVITQQKKRRWFGRD